MMSARPAPVSTRAEAERKRAREKSIAHAWRIAAIVLGTIAFIAVGLVYPAVERGDAWRNARWEHPWWLLGLVLAPVIVWRATLGVDARVPRLGLSTIAPIVRGPRGWRTGLRDFPGMIRGAAFVLGVLALARPQDVLKGEESDEVGIDIMIVLDLSGSMRAIMDQPPNDPLGAQRAPAKSRQTRLDTAKQVILDFIAGRKTDRIGVIVFGKNPYVLSPPTLDYDLLATLVQKMELDLIDGNGTAIGDAVGTAVAHLRRSDARSKTIILLTDGDSNAGQVDPTYAAHLAQVQSVKVFTVQLGNGDDVEVEDGNDLFGQPHYVRAHFPVNPELLKSISKQTGGESFVANDKTALEKSMHSILDTLQKTKFEAQAATMEDLFPFLLFPAVALVMLEALSRLLVVRRFP